MKTTELKIRLPVDMAAAVRTLAGDRDQSMNAYVTRAIRTQLIADATAMEAGSLMALIEQANQPLTRSANFAAVHAAATLAFVREWAKDSYMVAGLPEDMAQEKAQLLAENALDEALAVFEDPRTLHQFGWIERPDDDTDT